MTKKKKTIIIIASVICLLLIAFCTIMIKQYNEKKEYTPTPEMWDYNRSKDEYTNEASDVTSGVGVKQSLRVRDDKITINVDIDVQEADKQTKAIQEGKHVNSLIPYPYSQYSLYQICTAKYEKEGKPIPRLELSYNINGKSVQTYSYSYEEVNELLNDEDKIRQACDDWYSLPITEKDRQIQKEAEELNKTVRVDTSFAE